MNGRTNGIARAAALTTMIVVGAAQTAQAGSWTTYNSGLVDVGSPWTPSWPNYRYENFANAVGTSSSGTLSRAVSSNVDARATYFSSEVSGTLSGFTSLTTSVSVSGDQLRRITGTYPNGGPNGSDGLTSTTSGVSLAWYVMDLTGGLPTVWISSARLDLNSINGLGPTTFNVGLDASNFVSFNSGGTQGGLSFDNTLASGQYFGLIITTNTASGNDFAGMKFDQWINEDTSGWNPYAQQRNGNYGAYSEGTTTINLFSAAAVPGHGGVAALGATGLLGLRRRRR